MKQVIIDTNILLRLFTGETGLLQDEARKILDKIDNGKISALVNELVIAECIWVLLSVYKKTKPEVVEAIENIILRDGYEIRDKDIISESLNIFVKNNISWVDSYLYCQSKKLNLKLVTFDEKLVKLCK
ncbi:hypothetical protein COU93_00645 [Candidatus Shapirobacteria bacterium CG10_big_fil_rev_8_21_14_0_10_36_6]|uniref:PIN domain-containing protein n=2 Tax=Candidatus Shapironibacteriota TaxID=1752721 RepID=A0A2M8L2D9_9BACT|nr:MAG: hypothetical protein COU93_00645 [Candidatus Shapirobacteria bacterium CG10_big_fil_rev_8_21_14_0_10_36_6]